MLRVTIELVPLGIEAMKRTIATANIWNDGTGTPTQGNYKYTLFGKRNRVLAEGEVKGFPRKRLLAWDLMYRVLFERQLARHTRKEEVHEAQRPIHTDGKRYGKNCS